MRVDADVTLVPMTPHDSNDRHLAEPAPTSHGGRVELRLLQGSPGPSSGDALGVVVYQARWFSSERKWTGEVRISAPAPDKRSHEVVVAAPGDLPTWLSRFTETLLKTTARGVIEGAWPRRLTRWRPSPHEA